MSPRHRVDPAAKLAELARRYKLPDPAAAKLLALLHLLVGDPHAPTAIHDVAKAIDDHLADSLVALELEPVREARMAADIGSGAGLPGLALAIARPAARFGLVESAARKCAFLARAIEECDIPNATAVHARAESWTAGIGRHDLVTARALAPLDVVAEYAAPLLRLGGTLVVWRGRRDDAAEAAGSRAAEHLGLAPPEIRPVVPYQDAQYRHLYVYSKVTDTPSRFPRRPGIASKRPLGAGISPARRAI
jgi:16S rRNA (guanine527-N7)-methyltransferase